MQAWAGQGSVARFGQGTMPRFELDNNEDNCPRSLFGSTKVSNPMSTELWRPKPEYNKGEAGRGEARRGAGAAGRDARSCLAHTAAPCISPSSPCSAQPRLTSFLFDPVSYRLSSYETRLVSHSSVLFRSAVSHDAPPTLGFELQIKGQQVT